MNNKDSKTLIAHPAANVNLPIQLFADTNIIFGQKGTGKTQIIKTLCESMRASGLKCVSYIATEREDDFKSLLGHKGLVIDLDKIGVEPCEEEFRVITEWTDSNPTHFGSYLNWKKTEGNNTNKTRMKITRASAHPRAVIINADTHKNDKNTIGGICRDIKRISLEEYISKEDGEQLLSLLEKLKDSIYTHRRSDLIEENAVSLVNFSINKIKEVADKSTNSVSKPSTVGLNGYAEARIELLKAVKCILRNLDANELNEEEKIGYLDDKGDIFINTKYRMLCEISKTDEFKCGIRKLRETKEKLEYIKRHIFDSNINENLQQLLDLLEDQNIKTIEPFIGCSRQVINDKGDVYSPSNGEKGMLLLQRALMDEADAYFLDEPELGMGNSYIDTVIRPMLIDLSRRHKFVTVATHNANIAVRTLPYTSVYRTHSNGNYYTYIGNPFSDKLVNINNNDDVLNWADESLKSLEGGRDAFYERKDIYESNNS